MAKSWIKDDETDETPRDTSALSGDQVIALVRELIASNQRSQERVATMIPDTVAKSRQWWDDRNYPNVSALNPLGEKAHPRPELVREVFWLGYPMQKEELLREEIEAINKLRPGQFHLPNVQRTGIEQYNFFTVREKDPGMPNSPLIVMWPCLSDDDRALVARFDRGRGCTDMVEECLLPKVEELESVG